MKEQENYQIEVWCGNCDFKCPISIPKGVKVEDQSCPNCSVNDLRKHSKPVSFRPFTR